MKSGVKRFDMSLRGKFLILGFTLLIVTAVIAASVTSANSGKAPAAGGSNPVASSLQDPDDQDKFKPTNIRPGSEEAPAEEPAAAALNSSGDENLEQDPQDPVKEALSGLNNNDGSTGTANFTQSETSIVAFGNNVVIGFNDSGSFTGGNNQFTGWAYSSDGGNTFTDGGRLPTSAIGDAGDPVLARDEVTGRIYFSTLGFSGAGTIQMWRSDDNGVSWMAPVNATPGGSSEDKQWHTVDNFPGPGQGNVYLLSRRFGAGPGIYFFRSTDQGATFGPSGGTLIVSGSQGAFVSVGPDHSVYAFWYAGTTLQMRKSTDQGLFFGPPVTVASGLVGGTNGDLGLTGRRQGTATFAGFRSNEFPHAAVNPVNGNIYVTYNNNPAGVDKADVFLVQSTDGGATWSAPVRVNDDETTTDQWQPTLAVSTDGTRLGVFYYSRQEDPVDNNLFRYYGRIATLAGPVTTFTPSFPISDVLSLPEFGRDSVVNATYMGDYDHAAATPGFFHVVWSDCRDDLPGGAGRKDPNVYYAKIPLGLAVTTTVPAVGSIVSVAPTSFTVNVTDPVNPASLQAGDFTVNGIPADGVSYGGGTSIVFDFNSTPVTAEGLQTMHVAGGAFTREGDNDPVLEFTGTFRYDLLQLQVVSTVPPVGGTFTLPSPLVYDVNFNEPVAPASVQAGDLTLSGIAGSSVTGVSVLPGNMTARFTLDIPSEGIIDASIAAGAVTDQFGNPNGAFAGSYAVDAGTQAFPTPLVAKRPLGSLVYDPTAAGTIGVAGDVDSFTIEIDPGQTVTLLVRATTPGLRPTVSLRNPSSAVIGSAAASAAGQPALLQTVPAPVGGTYTIDVGGANNTTGDYTVQLILNAAQEAEGTVAGASNNTLATAQNINGSFIALQTADADASASRGAVTGTVDPAPYSAAAVPFGFEDISATGTIIPGLTNADDAAASIPVGFNFPFYGVNNASVFVSSNGLMTFEAANTAFTNSDLTNTPNQLTIAPFWDDLHTGGGQPASGVFREVRGAGPDQRLIVQWNQVRFFSGGTAGDTITFQAVLFADGRIRLNYADLASGTAAGNNGGSATVGVKAAGAQGPDRLLLAFNNGPNAFVGTGQSTLVSPPTPTPDLYSFTLNSGDTVSLAVKGLSTGIPAVALLDAGGAVVATGVGGATNLDNVVSNYVAGAVGTYYASVGGAPSAPYNLVITRRAAFDTEDNNSFDTAQPLAGSRGALGHIGRGGVYMGAAVPFGFEDISGTGTVIAGLTNQDDAAVSIPVGFSFPFYGNGNTSVFVSSNGLMTFGTANTAFTNADLTASPAQAAIAPFWDDLHTGGGQPASGVYFQVMGAGPDQRLIVQWNQVRFFSGGTAGDTITFQAVLFADGRIRLNYADLASGTAAGNNGGSATVGVKAAGAQGPDRLLLAFNNGPNAFVGTGQSTLVSQPVGDDWYSVVVGSNQDKLQVTTSTPGDGPGEFVNTLDPRIELYSPANVLLATGTPLADGRNESIFLDGLAPGTYRVRVAGEGDSVGEYFLSARPFLYNATGFSPPVDNVGLNEARAGQGLAVKFSLGGNQGLDILAPMSPVSQQIDCTSFAPLGPQQETSPKGNSGLNYDAMADQYIYVWSTDKAWKNTCRELNVKLKDGTERKAKFRFK